MKKSLILVKKSGVFSSPKVELLVVFNFFLMQKLIFCHFCNSKKCVFALFKMSKNVFFVLRKCFFLNFNSPSAGDGCSKEGGVGNILANWSLGRVPESAVCLLCPPPWFFVNLVNCASGSSELSGLLEPGGVGTTPF